jgi:myo-inositol 2-dehydrogenase / D-chiro-inositol 1-dehydrogenase
VVGRQISIGLLGTGRIGRMHAELLAHRIPGVELAVLQDVVPEPAEELGRRLHVEVARDADEVLHADLDAVAICTSTETHGDLIIRAARAGKNVFCEKPISLDLAETDRVIAAVDASGVALHVGFNRRFDPSHRAVRDLVASGDVGRPQLVRITSRDPEPPDMSYLEHSGGIFRDMTVHDFDMARFLVDQEVVEVFATGSVLVEPSIGDVGDVDTAALVLTYESGALALIDNCRAAVYGYDQRVEVLGSAGMARSENHRNDRTVLETADGSRAASLPRFFLERYLDSYVGQWRSFADAVANGTPTEVDGRTAKAPLVLGLAAARSLADGRPIRVEEAAPGS